MSSKQSKKKTTGPGRSGAARPGTPNKNKVKPPSEGKCKVVELTKEQMLLEEASKLRAEINRLEEENDGLKAKLSKTEHVENSVGVVDRSDLEKQLSDLKNENEKIQASIKEKDAKILKLQEELKYADDKNRNSETSFGTKLSQKETQLKETQLQSAMYKNRLTKLFGERVLSEPNVTGQRAQEQNKNLEKKLKEKDEAIKLLQEKFKSLQEQIDRPKSKKNEDDVVKPTAPADNTLNDLTRELKEAKQKYQEAESKIKELKNQISSKENVIQDLEQKIAEANTEKDNLIERLSTQRNEEQLKSKDEEIVSLRQKLETLQSDNASLKAGKQTTEKNEEKLKSKEEEIMSLKQKLEALQSDNASLKAGKQTTEKNEEKLKSKDEEIESLKQKLETLQRNEAQLISKNEEVESLGKVLKKLESDNVSLEAGKQTSEKEVEKHLKEIQSLKDDIAQLQKQKTVGDKTQSAGADTDKDLKKKYDQTFKELNDAKAEISELKNRLSQAVGAKIMDNNPNITDLSDENRPTKLAEKYSELYDNEWTDAYEEVEKELPNEQDIIKHLYQRLLDVFDFCRKSSEEYSRSLKSCALGLPSLTVENGRPKSGKIGVMHMRQLKELKKNFSPFLVEDVFQNYMKNRKLKLEKKVKTAEFIRKCMEICWLMSSQDPPVILDTGNVKGPFDGDRYRTYTKTGKTVDFVVWPPMLLHKDGPLLSKGVAQGK